MDLEIASAERLELDDAAVGAWLDLAHARLEEAFDSSFTDTTHSAIFGEVSE